MYYDTHTHSSLLLLHTSTQHCSINPLMNLRSSKSYPTSLGKLRFGEWCHFLWQAPPELTNQTHLWARISAKHRDPRRLRVCAGSAAFLRFCKINHSSVIVWDKNLYFLKSHERTNTRILASGRGWGSLAGEMNAHSTELWSSSGRLSGGKK